MTIIWDDDDDAEPSGDPTDPNQTDTAPMDADRTDDNDDEPSGDPTDPNKRRRLS